MDIIRDDDYEKFFQAYTHFRSAIKLDPCFARPYVGLLELRLREHFPGVGPLTTKELEQIILGLSRLAPKSAPDYCAQAAMAFDNDWNFPRAEELCQEALRADRNYELAHTYYAYMLTKWGRTAEARKELDKSERILPGKATIARVRGHADYVDRNFARAIIDYEDVLAREPHHALAFYWIGRAYEATGDYTNAIANFRTFHLSDATDPSAVNRSYDSLLKAFKDGGADGYWGWRWHATEGQPGDYYFKAIVELNLRHTNEALGWLKASYINHEHEAGGSFQTKLTSLLSDHYWDGLHDDSDFQAVFQNIGFPKVMRVQKQAAAGADH